MIRKRLPVRRRSYLFVFLPAAFFLFLGHQALLEVPFYWDEAGQFIPASLDLYRTGAWIPQSTLPNVHPPGLMAYLAAFWHIFGYSIAGTRLAMLAIAAFALVFTFLLAIELARGAPGTPAFPAAALLGVSPLFFAQSMLAQLDMPAMCFTVLALLLFLQGRIRASALACVALVLVKETGVAAPVLFGCWLAAERRVRQALWYLLAPAALCLWLLALKRATGHWLGNNAFAQYNLFYPLEPVRLIFAFLRRLYYLFAGSGHFIGTVALIYALPRMPLFRDRAWRVAGSLVALHVALVSALGGAVLERYLLPALPIVYIAFAVSLSALLPRTRVQALLALLACLIAANFINPPYPFPYENNLAFVSFVDLETEAGAAADLRPGTIATAFPMADALRRPDLGYVLTARKVTELKGFRAADIAPLIGSRPDMVIVYDTAWDPLHLMQHGFSQWLMRNYYSYQPPLSPEAIASLLSMRVERRWTRRGLWIALLVRRDAGQGYISEVR